MFVAKRIQRPRSSSTSSLYGRGSISEPRLSDVLSSVSTMLHCQMMRDSSDNQDKKMYPMFCEDTYTGVESKEVVTVKTIYNFLKQVFEVGQFSPECCIIALIYVNRLIGLTGVPLTSNNWKPVTISALVLAQKVWDDTPLINADFSVLYPVLKAKDVNALERKFLELLDFKLSISPALYAQYYFELRSICEEHMRSVKPLSKEQEQKLERLHLSLVYQKDKQAFKKKTTTIDDLRAKHKRQIIN